MHRFKICPSDQSYWSADILSFDAASIFATVHRLGCGDTDVLRDDAYLCTVRVGMNGVWSILQRDQIDDPALRELHLVC